MIELSRGDRRFRLLSQIFLASVAFAMSIGAAALLEATDEWVPLARLALMTAPSAILAWCVMRYPGWLNEGHRMSFLGRWRGNMLPSYVDDEHWIELETSAEPWELGQQGRFGTRPGWQIVKLIVSGAGAIVAAIVVTTADETSELKGGEVIAYLIFGGLALTALISVVKILTSRHALIVTSNGLTLGVALGYLPPLQLRQREILSVMVSSLPYTF